MNKRTSILASLAVTLALIFLSHTVSSTIPRSDPKAEDIYNVFLEGQRISQGVDPYERILSGDMSNNLKYPTYFPLFYEMSFLSQKLGLDTFERWIDFWRFIFTGCDCAIGLLFFVILAAKNLEWLGAGAAAFWLYNRWTLYIVTTTNFDFLPIFCMLAALALYPKKKWLALLLFSISLALKQVGIFIAPLFVIWAFTAEKEYRAGFKQAFKAGLVIASVPLITSLPFLAWNWEGFARSIAFSATRFGVTHSNLHVDSLDVLLGWESLRARIPMVVLLLGDYWFALKRPAQRNLAAVWAMTIFIGFNAVLFNQYLTWLLALVPLLVADHPAWNVQVPPGPTIFSNWRNLTRPRQTPPRGAGKGGGG